MQIYPINWTRFLQRQIADWLVGIFNSQQSTKVVRTQPQLVKSLFKFFKVYQNDWGKN